MQNLRILTAIFLGTLTGLTGCTKPSKEQILQQLKDNPSLLADAIKQNPEAFKDALQVAGEVIQKERMKDRQEKEAKEQEKHFGSPLQPKLDSTQAFKGPQNAKLVLVEYTDFECPYCAKGADVMAELLKKYPKEIKVTVKHLPLPFHKLAMPAAQYYEAIRMQNPKAALSFHDALFKKQDELRKDGEKFLESQAKALGIDMARLKKDIASDTVQKKIEADMNEARSFGFRGTPSFLVGGVPVRGALPPEEFAKIIDRLLQTKS